MRLFNTKQLVRGSTIRPAGNKSLEDKLTPHVKFCITEVNFLCGFTTTIPTIIYYTYFKKINISFLIENINNVNCKRKWMNYKILKNIYTII